MVVFPATLAPPAPFPLVVTQTLTQEFVAPGVQRATYRLTTSAGPFVVHVVGVNEHESTVRFGGVVASDRLISSGETVSSMARRTQAVAGINADYFDIGNTNQPLNVVVREGTLVRTPSKRVALDVRRDGTIHFESFRFSGSVRYGENSMPLTAVNEWPPQAGASFLTAAFGSLKAAQGVALATLEPLAPPANVAGSYRVTSVGDAVATSLAGPTLAFGPAAQSLAPPPNVGDVVDVAAQTDPALETVETAVGGGPLLAASGRPVDDPNAPAPEERDRRFPVAGAATTANGTLFLVAVDGRQPSLSIGLTRPEFAALMLGLGATDAMAFDSGGSATLVARVLGDAAASVQNVPSDGEERPVGDGFFVYSVAPNGPPARLVVRPSPVEALPRSDVPLRLTLVDDAGHSLGPVHLAAGDVAHVGRISRLIGLEARGVRTELAVRVVDRLTSLAIDPDRPNPDPGQTLALTARGFDALGNTVALGDAVAWSADHGTMLAGGRYRASNRDAVVTASAAGASAHIVVRVGRHARPLALFAPSNGGGWRFSSAPKGGPGSLGLDAEAPILRLAYDFSGDERAAYANGAFGLPGEPLEFVLDVLGDASGVGLRAAFSNRFGERRALTLAKRVDWNGWRRCGVVLPPDLNPPITLGSLYVVDALNGPATHATGTLAFRDPSAIVPGTP